jgi:hypothetical protein
MGSSPPVPQPTNPNTVAANQQTLNTGAGQASQQGSMVNQNNAYGSLNYTQSGTSPNGTPLYTANTTLSAPEQGLLNTLQGTQTSAGQQGQNLIQGANYGAQSPATAIGNATSGLTGQAVAQEQQYLQPFFQPQTQQLDTQLRNQGFDPSSPAYKQAMNNLMQSQGQTETGFVAQIEPQMYQQSLQNYELPAQLGGSLANLGAPQTPNSSFVQSPQLNIQPADLTGATASYNTAQQAAYQSQLAQQNAMMSGLFGLGTTALGVMGAPFTGGLSLGLLGAAPMGGGIGK